MSETFPQHTDRSRPRQQPVCETAYVEQPPGETLISMEITIISSIDKEPVESRFYNRARK